MWGRVEIYIRCEDCEICGNEINPGREEYIRELRVCLRCYEELRGPGKRGTHRVKNNVHKKLLEVVSE